MHTLILRRTWFVVLDFLSFVHSFFHVEGGGRCNNNFLLFGYSPWSIFLLYYLVMTLLHFDVHGKIDGISPYCFLSVTKCSPHTCGLGKVSIFISGVLIFSIQACLSILSPGNIYICMLKPVWFFISWAIGHTTKSHLEKCLKHVWCPVVYIGFIVHNSEWYP